MKSIIFVTCISLLVSLKAVGQGPAATDVVTCGLDQSEIIVDGRLTRFTGNLAKTISKHIDGYIQEFANGGQLRFGNAPVSVSCRTSGKRLRKKHHCEVRWGAFAHMEKPSKNVCSGTYVSNRSGMITFRSSRNGPKKAKHIHSWLPREDGFRGFGSGIGFQENGSYAYSSYSLSCHKLLTSYFCTMRSPCSDQTCLAEGRDDPVRISVVQAHVGTFAQ
ncbi:MAG: hypothetical protein HRU19_22725 [Pseudobacteriovorax sp.]|nr:hypothetical protein [Pseudobacteriovorax sp.]